MSAFSGLEPLNIADPETYTRVKGRLILMKADLTPQAQALLAEETTWALSVEAGLGRALADGLLTLLTSALPDTAQVYLEQIHRATGTGATLSRILAVHLPPVLLSGERLREKFSSTLAVMLSKGTYTLSLPLELLDELLAEADLSAAESYLELLEIVFRHPLTYNQSNRLVQHLPQCIRNFPARRRAAQIVQLAKVARIDLYLVDAFMEGMPKGLDMLPAKSLETFTKQALEHYRHSSVSGFNFLSLNSKSGQDACADLQLAAAFPRFESRLRRYAGARLGRPLAIHPMSKLGPMVEAPVGLACSDSHCVYLADEVDHFDTLSRNIDLYKTLIRLETGFFECGTFDFDLERAADIYPAVAHMLHIHPPEDESAARCDAERFLNIFPLVQLADDLLAVFELARVTHRLAIQYPGLICRIQPVLAAETQRLGEAGHWTHPLAPLYSRLVLRHPFFKPQPSPMDDVLRDASQLFLESVENDPPVEISACLTCRFFEQVWEYTRTVSTPYTSLPLPFGHRPYWRLVSLAQAARAASTLKIKMRLAHSGVAVYRSDLHNQLTLRQGLLSAQDIVSLMLARQKQTSAVHRGVDLSGVDLSALLQTAGVEIPSEPRNTVPAFYYPEWNHQLQDYLKEHVRVQESAVSGTSDGAFYTDTLVRRRGLIAHIRRAFELLKPEGLSILRQWPEGDDFDYRALIDFALDRRLGRIPSDRLFIKRLKQERNVAVLLLVDLSRSTANPVAGGHTTVLEVAKEALVLFCEALQVVGDEYALAGFSGTGRHSVDYFPIKDFDEPLGWKIRQRISALAPQRSTRMGAAVRHATARMAGISARVRLIILISDGYPNDFGYKSVYAIEDTRRAIQEARAEHVHVKAITVNIGSSPGLDNLYGRAHHHVIGDVHDLPGKLLRLYGTLTKPS